MQESGGASSAPDNVPVIQDHLGPGAMAENADVRLPESSSVDTHERGGALLVVGAAPALAKDIAGAEPAGEAEKAAAARAEALMSRAQDKAVHGREVETLPQEGKCTHKPPPGALPQKGERKTRSATTKGRTQSRRAAARWRA